MTTCPLPESVRLVEARIAEKLGPKRFNVWFKNAVGLAITDDHLHVTAPNPFIGEYIERHFADAIRESAREVTGAEHALCFAIDASLARTVDKKQPDRQVRFIDSSPERLARSHKRNGAAVRTLPLKGRLEDFVVGSSNRLAHAAVLQVIENPGSVYNPLFVHGGCGLGKTHLLQSVCNGMETRHPQLRWRYVTGEEFTNEYVCSVKAHEENTFRSRYRNLDVLVIDDVHFFANKRATQQEFLHTFKAIDAAGKQIVMASDAPPKMIGHFCESLVSRFVSGMVVRIDSPDVQVRADVLRRRAERLKVEITESVIQYIAEQFRANVRELEGALLKVIAQAHVAGQPITLSVAERAIRDLVRQTAPVVKLADIEAVVAIFFGLAPTDLHTTRKSRIVALARSVAMHLARKHTAMSYPEIGRFMGNKNHSTVILACRRVSEMLQRNDVVRWMTPAGEREENLAGLIADLEEQCGMRRLAS